MPKDKQDNAREGGREGAERLTSGFDRNAALLLQGRNSSGNASNAASLLDLRQKVNYLFGVLETVLVSLGDQDGLVELQSMRQRGFRRGR